MLDFFKTLFKKKTETDKFVLKAKRFGGTKLTCKEWAEQVANDPNPEAFERYCGKVIKLFDIKTLKGPNKLWSVFYGEYGDGKEPFSLDEFWNDNVDESSLEGDASDIEKAFAGFVLLRKINEKETEDCEVILSEAEWIKHLNDFENEHPFYFRDHLYSLKGFWSNFLAELKPECKFDDFSYYVFGKDAKTEVERPVKHTKTEWENIYDEFIKATGKADDAKEEKKPRKKKSTKK